jgi:hypothetical protein
MSALPEATRGADEMLPPTASGLQRPVICSLASLGVLYEGDMLASLNAQNQVGSTGSLTSLAVFQPGNPIKGGRWITFQPRNTNATMIFASASGQIASTAVANNGVRVLQDNRFDAWITQASRWVEVVGDSTGTLVYWQSSPNYGERGPGASGQGGQGVGT